MPRSCGRLRGNPKATRDRASLSPYRQSLRENLGQSRSDDLLLRAGYVVFDAQRRHCAGAGVDDAVRRTRVAIARLTNRTAVREVAHIRLYIETELAAARRSNEFDHPVSGRASAFRRLAEEPED